MVSNGKGKAKATEEGLNENTPLLSGEPSSSPTSYGQEPSLSTSRTSSWTRRLLVVALALLAISSLAIFIFLIVASYSYASYASHIKPETLVQEGAVVWRGPSDISIIQVMPEGVIVRVEGSIGIDADWIMGLEQQSMQMGLLEGARRGLGRWLVRRVDTVTVTLGEMRLYAPYDRSQHRIPDTPLMTMTVPSITVPLTTRRSSHGDSDESWLTQLAIPVVIIPNKNTSSLVDFGKDALSMGRVLVRATVASVTVNVGDGSQWWNPSSVFEIRKPAMEKIVKMALPPIPPSDGTDPMPSIAHLKSYSLRNTSPGHMELFAEAEMPNSMACSSPLSGKELKLPTVMTVTMLPVEEPNPKPGAAPVGATIARVEETSIAFTHPNMTISITGTVLPLTHEATPYLAGFITRYLTSQDSPILITTPPPFSLSFKSVIPGPVERPKIIKTIRMKEMKLHPPEGNQPFVASGTIEVGIALPDAISSVEMEVDRILPDILLFDGPPPLTGDVAFLDMFGAPMVSLLHARSGARLFADMFNDDERPEPEPFPAPPLPRPLPPGAWARIRPTKWLNASSVPAPDPTEPGKNLTLVTSPFENLPLDILPGRGAVFRQFLQKIIFKGGAVAGMRGVAAVRVDMEGLLEKEGGVGMEIKGMPLEGEFTISRGTVWRKWSKLDVEMEEGI